MSGMTLLEYLRSRTQVDLDTFDIEAARELKDCIDCTSNQFEYFNELSKGGRKDVLEKAIKLAQKEHGNFASVTMEELAVEAAAVYMAIEIRPFVKGDIHVMANPWYAYSKEKIIAIGRRFHELFALLDAGFDRTRLVMKVPATWEGLQACRELRDHGIKTLGTTLFTMEQAVLAGEVGCVSISPFIHELKALFDESYRDGATLLDLCVRAQRWYDQNYLPTKVKACANIGVDEIIQLAGVAAFTIVPDDLRLLDSTRRGESEIHSASLFNQQLTDAQKMDYTSYIDEESKYRMDFAHADDGSAQLKLGQAIQIFCDFQVKAEGIVRAAMQGDS
ncbi:Transaldolase [Aspergillus affinis]|uniref:Transaldolase n=1 Tax=Aspergillus affinis TaxID=1070780 RepID=UPI0022FDB4FF|nr:Transaldolase [Aspergillus affinis]KAI9036021.1 Transaldolase [Aspergillus affinis]